MRLVRCSTQVHQSQLETVLPKRGGSVMALSGAHAGVRGTLLAIDEEKFQAQARKHIVLLHKAMTRMSALYLLSGSNVQISMSRCSAKERFTACIAVLEHEASW